jgi:hypothetical protein
MEWIQQLLGINTYISVPTTSQKRALDSIESRINTEVSEELVEAKDLLETIRCSVPDHLKSNWESNGWRYFGFQSDNPMRDIRAGGILSLEQMSYFLCKEEFCEIAKAMIEDRSKRDGVFEGENYPWAAVSVNITFIVTQFILKEPICWELLDIIPDTEYLLYILFFLMLDSNFTKMNGTYVTFPTIMKSTQTEFETTIKNLGTGGAKPDKDSIRELYNKYLY